MSEDGYSIVAKSNREAPAYVCGASEVLVRQWLALQSDVSTYEVRTPDGEYHPAEKFWDISTSVASKILALEGRSLGRNFFPQHMEFIPKFYLMDPETEVVFPNATYLADGMTVLIESPQMRTDVESFDENTPRWQIDRAMEWNRWCKISNVQVIGDKVKFIGTYSDGVQRVRNWVEDRGWLVKKNTIETSRKVASERYINVHELVKRTMSEMAQLATSDEPDADKVLKLNQKAEEATRQILKLI